MCAYTVSSNMIPKEQDLWNTFHLVQIELFKQCLELREGLHKLEKKIHLTCSKTPGLTNDG